VQLSDIDAAISARAGHGPGHGQRLVRSLGINWANKKGSNGL